MQTNIHDTDCNAKLFKHEHEIKQFRPLIDIYLHPDLYLQVLYIVQKSYQVRIWDVSDFLYSTCII